MISQLKPIFLPFNGLKLLVLLFPFLAITGAYFIYKQDPFLLVHSENKEVLHSSKVIPVNDSLQQGKSKVEILENNSRKLSYRYTISNAFLNPYAGISYTLDDGNFFDLSGFDYVKLKIKASHGKRINFTLSTDIHGDEPSKSDFVIRQEGYSESYRLSTTAINTDIQYQELTIPIEQMTTPEWWFIEAKISEKERSPNFAKVKFIYFGNCVAIQPGIEDVVELEEIVFHKDYKSFYTASVIGLFFYFAIVGALFYKRKKVVEVNFQHGKLTSANPLTSEEEVVFGYVTSHYMNQDLCIADIQKASGYTENKISDIIRIKTGMNFKSFLNKLRISEAKRLLLETDLNVSEIAEKVGYSNVTHFNRVFKSLAFKSPNEVKKEYKEQFLHKEEKA